MILIFSFVINSLNDISDFIEMTEGLFFFSTYTSLMDFSISLWLSWSKSVLEFFFFSFFSEDFFELLLLFCSLVEGVPAIICKLSTDGVTLVSMFDVLSWTGEMSPTFEKVPSSWSKSPLSPSCVSLPWSSYSIVCWVGYMYSM